MAEGQEDDSSDVMLVTGPTSAVIKREPEAPLNLKSEESCDSNCPSPEPATMGADNTPLAVDYNHASQLHSLMNGHHSLPGTPNHNHSGPTTPEPELSNKSPAAHINGTMAGMVTLQNLQNLAALQGLPQMAPMASGFQGIPGLGTQFINTPLNLSANATGALPNGGTPAHTVGNLLNSAASQQSASATQPAAMPQFILTSGQLVQGIQGAQLLIPTSQGLATQTILTIPVNHVTSGQMVNLALNNGQVVTTTLANLQSMAQPHHLLSTPSTNTANTAPSPSPTLGPNLGLNSASLPHILSNSSHQQLLAALQQTHLVNQQQQQQQQQQSLVTTSQQSQHRSSHHQHHQQQHQQQQQQQQQNHHYSLPDKHHSNGGLLNGSESSMHVINRLAASNSDITITTTNQMPAMQQHKSSHYSSSNGSQHSPSSDFLADSPNQPTINQTSGNVVDGINLDEIKEFAKAFKLRRLSLGLTQTQVGQALSITEGPAYSQSAICSALATQMYCAQLASQHQNMFEKLDITPKSAQKIKPVLEMWMKEAEESFNIYRYKSGQNHLTDFIGVEPSKKRKRRTSFTPQALELLNAHFERNTHPSGTEITALGHQLGYDREVIRIWFCNKRQALKNTVRMMSKGMV